MSIHNRGAASNPTRAKAIIPSIFEPHVRTRARGLLDPTQGCFFVENLKSSSLSITAAITGAMDGAHLFREAARAMPQ